MHDTFMIAEIGVNHGGSLETAKKLVYEARSAGADAVKFQTFKASRLASASTPKAPYQQRHKQSRSHLSMLEDLELSRKDHERIQSYCSELDIEFFSTPYSQEDAEFLLELEVPKLKVASADIVDIPLLEFLAQHSTPVLMSTGMASDAEIAQAIEILRADAHPEITLLHTTSLYPTPPRYARMQRLVMLGQHGTHIGFSDHTQGSAAATLAVALGARTFEKHFTIDKQLPGPDHFASVDPHEFRQYIHQIRTALEMLGDGSYAGSQEENAMADTSRKSIHTRHDLPIGHKIAENDLQLMRPGSGILWRDRESVIGRQLRCELRQHEQIHRDHFL